METEILDRREKIPKDLVKYWKSRYTLFSKFDDGIKLTRELWFSVTPQDLAVYTAKFIRHCYPDTQTVLDLFCGGGGNSIQFIRVYQKCVCVDYNEVNLACTANNVHVYFDQNQLDQAGKSLQLLNCDWKYALPNDNPEDPVAYAQTQSIVKSLKVDIIFASPPWGGPKYLDQETFDLRALEPLPLDDLLRSCLQISDKIVLFLPRNSDLDQLHRMSMEVFGPAVKVRVTKAKINGRIKGLLCFWGSNFYDYQRN